MFSTFSMEVVIKLNMASYEYIVYCLQTSSLRIAHGKKETITIYNRCRDDIANLNKNMLMKTNICQSECAASDHVRKSESIEGKKNQKVIREKSTHHTHYIVFAIALARICVA